ncbi:MAG: hypothetical protein M0036_06330 [Desulfobacteraceae bacterium]|nr:hypothetical protein [Desulfobacteraceae bacterium]
MLNSPPRVAHIHIKGPNNVSKEYAFSFSDLESEEIGGFQLTDRYAIQIDLQWLWYELEDLNVNPIRGTTENTTPLLAPWFVCKYRF